MTPQADVDAQRLSYRAGVCAYAESRGAAVLNLQEKAGEMGLDPKWDYYNPEHTNIHGSAVFTAYLTDYLVEHYGFSDKRGTEACVSWTEAAEKYDEKIASVILPFEREPKLRFKTEAVKPSFELAADGGVQLNFASVAGAEGYSVFRKARNAEPWELAGETADESFIDKDGKSGYYYLVAPFMESDGVRYYGTVDYRGVIVQ